MEIYYLLVASHLSDIIQFIEKCFMLALSSPKSIKDNSNKFTNLLLLKVLLATFLSVA